MKILLIIRKRTEIFNFASVQSLFLIYKVFKKFRLHILEVFLL